MIGTADGWDKPYTEEGPTKGKIRKLSVTVTFNRSKRIQRWRARI